MMRAVCHSDILPINNGMKDMSACHELALRTLASTGQNKKNQQFLIECGPSPGKLLNLELRGTGSAFAMLRPYEAFAMLRPYGYVFT